jgi:DNA-binding transcriptional LysR family regulator
MSVLIVDLLRHVKVEAPKITFDHRPMGRRAMEDLDGGELDFLIAPEYLAAVHPTEVLFEDSHTCLAWNRNRHVGSSISLDDYLRLGHVIVRIGEPDSVNHDEIALRRLNHKRTVEVVTPAFDLAPQLVVGTDRITTVPTRLACKYAQFLPLNLLPLRINVPPLVSTCSGIGPAEDPAHLWLRRKVEGRRGTGIRSPASVDQAGGSTALEAQDDGIR